MLLNEIIGVKKFHSYTDVELATLLANEYGLGWLGMGSFGMVIGSPDPNWVYKIFENDPAFMKYLTFIQQYPNKHYPIVKKIKKLHSFYNRTQLHNDIFYVAVIERLYPMDLAPLGFILDDLIPYIEDIDISSLMNKQPDSLPNGQDNVDEWTFEELTYKWPWIIDFALAWKSLLQLEDNNINMDAHAGNFMQRRDGTPVIIDPLAPSGKAMFDNVKKQTIIPTKQGPIYQKKSS